MFNFFKRKTTKNIEEEFLSDNKEAFFIGKYDFSIDFENTLVKIEGNILVDLEIKASEKVFDTLCENDDFEFGYGIYSPQFYARGINLGKKRQISITKKNRYRFEVGLYFMEHNTVNVDIYFFNNWILVTGRTYMFGEEYPLVIKMKVS